MPDPRRAAFVPTFSGRLNVNRLCAPVTSSERVRQREPEPFDDGVGRCDKPQKKPRSFLGPVSAPRGAEMKDHDRRYP